MKIVTSIPHVCGGVAEVETDMYQTPMGREDSPPCEGYAFWLQEGDPAVCSKCGTAGVVDVDDGEALVTWETRASIDGEEARAQLAAVLQLPGVVDKVEFRLNDLNDTLASLAAARASGPQVDELMAEHRRLEGALKATGQPGWR